MPRDGLPSLAEVCHFLTQPSAQKRGMRFVRSIHEENGFYAVALKGYKPLIYWPISWGLWTLGMILNEQFDPTDWHYYLIPETMLTGDDIAVDCGAAEGLFSLIASSICKRCYCIEPAPSFQPFLRKTFAGIDNVEIVPSLVSDFIGETHIEDAGINSKETRDISAPAIPVTTLDALFFDRDLPFTYLKADVEGAEMRLLEGAKKSIRKFRPRIAITTYHEVMHADQITGFLHDIHPDYHIRTKGIVPGGQPVMLHAW